MKKFIMAGLILIGTYSAAFSQIRYSGKVEGGYLSFISTTIDIDPGPNWKGHYLNEDQNGIDLNFINGIKFKEKLFAGIGIGYLNFEGIHGTSVFSDLEYIPLTYRFSPLLNVKIGYCHIWNQYEGGRGTSTLEFGGGFRYKISDRMGLYLQSGFLFAQQSSFYPLKIGLDF